MQTSQPVGVILAAGFGTRMRPLTQALPKPLLPFLNTPLLVWSIDHLARAGVRHIGINLHHLGDLIPQTVAPILEALRPVYGELRVTYVKETEARGTAGGIAGLWEAMGRPNNTLISINGDSVMSFHLGQHLQRHRDHGAPITMVVRPTDGQHPGGLWVDAEHRVSGLRKIKRTESTHELDFAGVHILEPEALQLITEAAKRATLTCMVADVYTDLLGTEIAPRVSLGDEFWMAMDNPALLLEATRRVLDTPDLYPQANLPKPMRPGMYIHTPSQISNSAMLSAPVLLGAFASIGAGAKIGPHVVIDATEVAPGTRIKNAVLFGMGRVEGTWEDCIAIRGQIAQL